MTAWDGRLTPPPLDDHPLTSNQFDDHKTENMKDKLRPMAFGEWKK